MFVVLLIVCVVLVLQMPERTRFFHTLPLLNNFDKIVLIEITTNFAFRSPVVVYVGDFLEANARMSKNLCVHCGL